MGHFLEKSATNPAYNINSTFVLDMDLHALCFTVLYGIAFVYLVYLLYAVSNKTEDTNAAVIAKESWWPWSITTYNQWPQWTGWYSSGGDGGYKRSSGLDQLMHSHDESRPWGRAGRGANHAAPTPSVIH